MWTGIRVTDGLFDAGGLGVEISDQIDPIIVWSFSSASRPWSIRGRIDRKEQGFFVRSVVGRVRIVCTLITWKIGRSAACEAIHPLLSLIDGKKSDSNYTHHHGEFPESIPHGNPFPPTVLKHSQNHFAAAETASLQFLVRSTADAVTHLALRLSDRALCTGLDQSLTDLPFQEKRSRAAWKK